MHCLLLGCAFAVMQAASATPTDYNALSNQVEKLGG
jgi:predicted outer membrane lipoprotein